jgi:phenylacetate-CoA ligase
MTPRLDVDIFLLDERTVGEICKKIINYKPMYFRGYVSALANFGRLVKQKKLSISGLNLKAIIVTSEILYESDRAFIESVFNCKVANEYGAAEAGLFACECPEGGMHIQEDSLFLFADENNELVSTEFNNKLMPLINYKVGDKVVMADRKCKCGRELSLI